jgi:hypothetical protein
VAESTPAPRVDPFMQVEEPGRQRTADAHGVILWGRRVPRTYDSGPGPPPPHDKASVDWSEFAGSAALR